MEYLTEAELRYFRKKHKREIDRFEKKYRKEINHSLLFNLLNAYTFELQKLLGGKRFLAKTKAIVDKLNEQYNQNLPLIIETFREKGIQAALAEIEDIGIYFHAPDLRGLHRRKKIPVSGELFQEYDRVHKMLKDNIKRRWRNPVSKKIAVQNVLTKALNLDNPDLKEHVERWINLPLSEIAMSALGLKYGVSRFTIKKALKPRKTLLKFK